MKSKGSEALKVAVNEAGGQLKACRKLGVAQGAVSMWIAGDRSPDGDNRDVIELVFKVPRGWWRLPPDPPPPQRGASKR